MHRYYKRSGGSFLEMEPCEIRDVIFRFRYPKVELGFHHARGEKTAKPEGDIHIYGLQVVLSGALVEAATSVTSQGDSCPPRIETQREEVRGPQGRPPDHGRLTSTPVDLTEVTYDKARVER